MPVRPLFDLRPETAAPERGRTLSCISCGLYKDVQSPKMGPYGENRRRVMVVGEGPGRDEDRTGKPWQGVTGRLVQDVVRSCGLELFRDCVSLNAVNCRPVTSDGKNREPTPHEVACCRARVVNPAIERYSPRVVLLMGGSAISSVLGPMCADAIGASVGRWRGFAIPVPELGAWVCPTYHPSYVSRELDKKSPRIEVDTVWRSDVRRALGLIDTLVPALEDLNGKVEIIRAEVDILRAIYRAHDAEFLAYDYETTGLNPNYHEIICVSFAASPDRAVAFMMPKDGPIPGAWAKLMANPSVGKIAHSMKFENEWTREHFGVEEIRWAWDSMLAAHVVDSRVGICSLDFQAFINFGIRDWSGLIGPYLKAVDPSDPASPNRIWEFIEKYGEDEALVYCGIDSLLSFRLAMRQMELINGS